jgi:ParB/RepB/Spo0J family partition protein
MTIQNIPFSTILPPANNPRTAFDASGIEGLAASIQADGLLQNLVVTPEPVEEPRYRLVSGERRYRALRLLVERGDLADDAPVPVEIRAELSAEDTLRLATVENVQRENLTPLEEAAAFAALIQHGTPIDEVSAQTGIGVTTIRRRLAIAGLCDEAKQALARGELSLAQAESLTLGSHDAQRALLEQLASGYQYDADDIRGILLERKPGYRCFLCKSIR